MEIKLSKFHSLTDAISGSHRWVSAQAWEDRTIQAPKLNCYHIAISLLI